jgi:hypothetical protein
MVFENRMLRKIWLQRSRRRRRGRNFKEGENCVIRSCKIFVIKYKSVMTSSTVSLARSKSHGEGSADRVLVE